MKEFKGMMSDFNKTGMDRQLFKIRNKIKIGGKAWNI